MGSAVRGGGVGIFGIPRGASRLTNPRLAPCARPHPARGPGEQRGWMGPDVGPAFQRRSRGPLPFLIGVRLAETTCAFQQVSGGTLFSILGARLAGTRCPTPGVTGHARATPALRPRYCPVTPGGLLIGGVTESRSA
eukprot:gene16521-biopygen18800